MLHRRILSLLLLLGLILVPAGMPGFAALHMDGRAIAAEMSHHAASAEGDHCLDLEAPRPADQSKGDNCCVMTCVAVPAVGGELVPRILPASARQPLPRFDEPHGLRPEAEPPPPRFS